MRWGLVPYALSAVISLLCAFVVWSRRDRPGAKSFTAMLLAQSVWSAGYVRELASSSLEDKLFWDNVQYLALIVLAPSLLAFAWEYRETWPKRAWSWLVLSSVLPIATVASILLRPDLRASAHVEPTQPFGVLIYAFSPFEWLLALQLYVTVLVVSWGLLRDALTQHPHHRVQSAIIGFGLAAPMLSSVFGMLGVRSLLGQRDIAPACFGVAGVLITWALYRGRFFDLAPVARHVVFENLPNPVLVLDAEDRVLDLNPGAQALVGARRHVIGQPLGSALGEAIARQLSAGEGRHELELEGKVFEARSEPLGVHGRVLVMSDVSERKAVAQQLARAHEALEARVAERTRELHEANCALVAEVEERRRAEQRFRALFDHAIELMGIVHPDGRLLEANRTALDFAGVARGEVEGIPFWNGPWWRHSAEQREQLRASVKRAAAGQLVSMQVTHVDHTGALRDFAFSLKPFASDAVDGFVLLAGGRDITDLKRAEQERASLKEALHQAQRMESVGRLAGGIAHDFNNLLTVILGQSELAQTLYEAGRDPRPSLAEVMQAATSASGLTRQLLAFARKQPTRPRVLSINDVIRETSAMLERLIGEDVQLRLELSPSIPHVSIDSGQLEQLLLNLAVNARDAMPRGGQLTIRTESVELGPDTPAVSPTAAQRDYVGLYVSDTGVGMSEEVMARLFEPFFTTKAVGKGTGIGLSTVQGIVQQAGGFIEVHSKLGEGSTFAVKLPASHAELSPRAQLPSEIARGVERVALVEDQAQLRELLGDQLRQLGYRVTSFARAEDALELLDGPDEKFDILVTDVVLAGMSGPALAATLRERGRTLKVLYISGYTNDGAMTARGLDEKAERLLYKPFTLRDLAQAVRAVLAGGT